MTRFSGNFIVEITVGLIGFFSGIYESWVEDPNAPIFVAISRMNAISMILFSTVTSVVVVSLKDDIEYEPVLLVSLFFAGGLAAPVFAKTVKSMIETYILRDTLILLSYDSKLQNNKKISNRPGESCMKKVDDRIGDREVDFQQIKFKHRMAFFITILFRIVIHSVCFRMLFPFKRILSDAIFREKIPKNLINKTKYFFSNIILGFWGFSFITVLFISSFMEIFFTLTGSIFLSFLLTSNIEILNEAFKDLELLKIHEIVENLICSKTCSCNIRKNREHFLEKNDKFFKDIMRHARLYVPSNNVTHIVLHIKSPTVENN